MNKLSKVLLASLIGFIVSGPVKAAGEHSRDEHDHKEEHTETKASEAPPNIGAEKGIIEVSEKDGIKLSEKATKNFGIKTVRYSGGVITLPKSAIFFGLQERNLYRIRNGFYLRIDFKTLSKTRTEYNVTSPDLTPGDLVATEGLGFIRIAELAATGGAVHGHSH